MNIFNHILLKKMKKRINYIILKQEQIHIQIYAIHSVATLRFLS